MDFGGEWHRLDGGGGRRLWQRHFCCWKMSAFSLKATQKLQCMNNNKNVPHLLVHSILFFFFLSSSVLVSPPPLPLLIHFPAHHYFFICCQQPTSFWRLTSLCSSSSFCLPVPLSCNFTLKIFFFAVSSPFPFSWFVFFYYIALSMLLLAVLFHDARRRRWHITLCASNSNKNVRHTFFLNPPSASKRKMHKFRHFCKWMDAAFAISWQKSQQRKCLKMHKSVCHRLQFPAGNDSRHRHRFSVICVP